MSALCNYRIFVGIQNFDKAKDPLTDLFAWNNRKSSMADFCRLEYRFGLR